MERHQCCVYDALVFATELFGDQSFQLFDVEIENFCDQAKDENVFALVLGGAAERFDGQTSDRHADINETFVVQVRLDVVRIVKQDPALAQKTDVVLVTVLVERDQKISFVACRQDFAGADAHLKNGRPTRDRRWNRHVRHDIVFATAGEPREERPGGLNSVLRVSCQPDYGILNTFRAQIGSLAVWRGCLCSSIRSFTHGIRKLTD